MGAGNPSVRVQLCRLPRCDHCSPRGLLAPGMVVPWSLIVSIGSQLFCARRGLAWHFAAAQPLSSSRVVAEQFGFAWPLETCACVGKLSEPRSFQCGCPGTCQVDILTLYEVRWCRRACAFAAA